MSAPPPKGTSGPPADPDALRRHYEQKVTAVRSHLMKEHVATAEQASASGDWVAAANAYRLALQVSPEDANVQRLLGEVQVKANAVLADSYRKQATYEEKSGKLSDAARSWQRVAKAAPDDAESHGRAATCMLRAGTDLRTAANLAQRAIALVPTKLEYRVTLAEVYLAAGLSLNARRELEAAARLAPDDANIEALLKRAGKR
jgi:predicted TPR repeat methyltransferase